MNKKFLFITFFIIVLGIIGFIGNKSYSSQKDPVLQLNTKAEYDTPLFNKDQKQLETPSVIMQKFKSGKAFSIYVPESPVASSSALTQSGIKGVQIVSADYYINIIHLVKLDDSNILCTTLSKTNMHKDMVAKNEVKIPTKKGSSYRWDLVSQDSTLKQINSCIIDGKQSVWIIDLYFPEKIYSATYKTQVVSILDSFKITSEVTVP